MARSELDVIIKVKDQASGPLKSIGKAMIGIGVALGAAAAAAKLTKAAFDFGKSAAEMMRLRAAGVRLAAGFGQSMDAIVASMADASNNTISDMELIGLANKALQLRVARTPEEFAKLTKTAIAMGQAMDRGPIQSMNDIIVGIGRLSPRILDNLGIWVDLKEGLDDTAQKQELLTQVMAAAEPILDANGDVIKDTATAYEQMEVAITNTKASMMAIIDVGLTGEFSWIIDLLKDMSGQWELQAWAVQNNINLYELSKEGLDNLTTAFFNAQDGAGGLSSKLNVTDGWLEKIKSEAPNFAAGMDVATGALGGAADEAARLAANAAKAKKALDDLEGAALGFGGPKALFTPSQTGRQEGLRSFFLGTGRQHGGTMTVPQGFPNDSFPVGVSSGEQVSVSNRDERSFFSGSNVNINNGTDLEAFEAILRQVQ